MRRNNQSGNAVKTAIIPAVLALFGMLGQPAVPAYADKGAATNTAAATSTSQPAEAGGKKSTSTAAKESKKTSSKSGHLPTIYDFGAAWCVPCHKFAPIFDKVKEQYVGKAEFVHVDFDDPKSKGLIDKYKVTEIPTLLMVNAAGKVKYEKSGILEEKELIEQVNKVVGH